MWVNYWGPKGMLPPHSQHSQIIWGGLTPLPPPPPPPPSSYAYAISRIKTQRFESLNKYYSLVNGKRVLVQRFVALCLFSKRQKNACLAYSGLPLIIHLIIP